MSDEQRVSCSWLIAHRSLLWGALSEENADEREDEDDEDEARRTISATSLSDAPSTTTLISVKIKSTKQPRATTGRGPGLGVIGEQ